MHALAATGTTGPDGTLTLSLPVGRPNAAFDAVVVLHPRPAAPAHDPWAAVNAFRQRLAAAGGAFADSAELIREDRDR
jgi:hypothetical protein